MNRFHFVPALLFFFVLILSFSLRIHHYATWPRLGATFDEFAWTWQGMSILQEGVPQSWSYHPHYKERKLVTIQQANFILVRPYLEHPPIFGLVAGSFALASGQTDFSTIALSKMRVLSLLLGMISVVLVYWLAMLLYGKKVGLLAAVMYGVTPTVAIGSRLVQNENFFIPVWLGMLILLWYYLKTKRIVYRTMVGLLGGLLILSKIPWIAGVFSAAAILWFAQRIKDALWVLFVALGVGSLYIFYGMHYDKEVFMGLMGLQLNRYDITFSGIYSLWLKPLLADRYFLDGWIYWGWAALFLLFREIKKHQFIVFAALSYFLIYILGIPDELGHGWYRFPFYPFLSIAAAYIFVAYVAVNPTYRFISLLIIGLPLLGATWGTSFGFSYLVYRGYILWSLFSFLPYVWSHKQSNRITNLLFYGQVIFIFFLTVWTIVGYNEQ